MLIVNISEDKLKIECILYFPFYCIFLQSKQVNYETVQNLPYLDMVFCETSRLASIGEA